MAACRRLTASEIAGLNLNLGLETQHCEELLGALNRFRSHYDPRAMMLRGRDRLKKIRAHSQNLGKFLTRMRGSSHPGRRLDQIENTARKLAVALGGSTEETLHVLSLCFPFAKVDLNSFKSALYRIAMIARAREYGLLRADAKAIIKILSRLTTNARRILKKTAHRPADMALYRFISDVGAVFTEVTGGGVGAHIYLKHGLECWKGKLLDWVFSLAKLGGVQLHRDHTGRLIKNLRRGTPRGKPRQVFASGVDGPLVSGAVARALFKGNKKEFVVLKPGDKIKLADGSVLVTAACRIDRAKNLR